MQSARTRPRTTSAASKDADNPLRSARAAGDDGDEGGAGGGDRHRHVRQHGTARRQGRTTSRRSSSRARRPTISSRSSHATRTITRANPCCSAIYEFSARDSRKLPRGGADVAAESRQGARPPSRSCAPKGGTPIGDAMIKAKLALDATGLARNTCSSSPTARTRTATSRTKSPPRSASAPKSSVRRIYFVAFDVDAKIFAPRQERRRPGHRRGQRQRAGRDARHAAAGEDPDREVGSDSGLVSGRGRPWLSRCRRRANPAWRKQTSNLCLDRRRGRPRRPGCRTRPCSSVGGWRS